MTTTTTQAFAVHEWDDCCNTPRDARRHAAARDERHAVWRHLEADGTVQTVDVGTDAWCPSDWLDALGDDIGDATPIRTGDALGEEMVAPVAYVSNALRGVFREPVTGWRIIGTSTTRRLVDADGNVVAEQAES